MATKGRDREIGRFVESLGRQTNVACELIVVDQNSDERVDSYLRTLPEGLTCVKVKSTPGLSKARNTGSSHVSGDIVGFPDDDCWYSEGLLKSIDTWFQEHPQYSFLLVSGCDEQGAQTPASSGMRANEVTLVNCLRICISYTIFALRERHQHQFDELLGVGAGTAFGSGEDMDYVIQLLTTGGRGWYEPTMTVFHPDRSLLSGSIGMSRAFAYGAGIGCVLGKHPLPFKVKARYAIANPVAGAILSLIKGRIRATLAYTVSFAGRIYGYVQCPRGTVHQSASL